MKKLDFNEMEVVNGGDKDLTCALYAIGFIVGAGSGQGWFAAGMAIGWTTNECWHY